METTKERAIFVRCTRSLIKLVDAEIRRRKKELPGFGVTRADVARMALERFFARPEEGR